MSYEPEPPADNQAAADRTNLPGMFLMVVGILNLLVALLFSYRGIQVYSSADLIADEFARQIQQAQEQNKQESAQLEEFKKYATPDSIQKFSMGFVVTGILGVIASFVTFMGGVKMRSLQGYGLALAGAILAAIPALSPTACCCLGEGIGIWALVVLLSTDVKSAFR